MNIALKLICARGLSKFRRRGFPEVQYAMLTVMSVSKPHKK